MNNIDEFTTDLSNDIEFTWLPPTKKTFGLKIGPCTMNMVMSRVLGLEDNYLVEWVSSDISKKDMKNLGNNVEDIFIKNHNNTTKKDDDKNENDKNKTFLKIVGSFFKSLLRRLILLKIIDVCLVKSLPYIQWLLIRLYLLNIVETIWNMIIVS